MLIQITLVIIGIVLAFFGRRLLWLLVAVVGFLFGYSLAGWIFSSGDQAIQIVVGLAVGILFAILTKGFTRLLLGLGGFILVGGMALNLTNEFDLLSKIPDFVIFILGGLIGVGLVSFAFDLSLILFSALGGAALVVQGLPGLIDLGSRNLLLLAGMLVAVLGFLVQWQGWKKR